MTTILDFGDPKAALLDYLASHPLVLNGIPALNLPGCPADQISARRPLTKPPTPYITAIDQGGYGADGSGVQQRVALRVICYGSTGLNAKNLERLVYIALCPDPLRQPRGFVAKGTQVIDVSSETGVEEAVDPQTGIEVRIRRYILTIQAQVVTV